MDMTHILEGDWTSRIFDGQLRDDPPVLHLLIDEGTGTIRSGSVHGTDPLTGSVRTEGTLHVIEINNVNRRRRYEGVFCADVRPASGGSILVLAGKLRLNVTFNPDGAPILDEGGDTRSARSSTEKSKSADFVQDQAIWVATKP